MQPPDVPLWFNQMCNYTKVTSNNDSCMLLYQLFQKLGTTVDEKLNWKADFKNSTVHAPTAL